MRGDSQIPLKNCSYTHFLTHVQVETLNLPANNKQARAAVQRPISFSYNALSERTSDRRRKGCHQHGCVTPSPRSFQRTGLGQVHITCHLLFARRRLLLFLFCVKNVNTKSNFKFSLLSGSQVLFQIKLSRLLAGGPLQKFIAFTAKPKCIAFKERVFGSSESVPQGVQIILI